MKILPSNIETFIKNILKQEVKGVFLYGDDIGVLTARADAISKAFLHFEHIRFDLSGNQEGKIMHNISVESFTQSFFHENKLILISGNLESQFLGLEEILLKSENAETFPNFFIVSFLGGTLDAKSKMRKYVEGAGRIASLPCYPDESATLVQIIKEFFAKNGLTAETSSIIYIAQNFSGNRSALLLELEKLKTYKQTGHVSLKDIKEVMQEAEESTITGAVNHFFNRNIKALEDSFLYLDSENIPAGVLIYLITNYALKLLEFNEEQEHTGKQISVILAEKFIFFKQIPIMKEHMKFWNKSKLNQLLPRIMKAEIEGRKHNEEGFNLICLILPEFMNII